MKLRKELKHIDESKHGLVTTYTPPSTHRGYCPVQGGRTIGRYRYYQVADLLGEGCPIYDFDTACAKTAVTTETKPTTHIV